MISGYGFPPLYIDIGFAFCIVLIIILCTVTYLSARSRKALIQQYNASLEQQDILRHELHDLELEYRELSSISDAEKKHHQEKLSLLENAREEMSLQFQHIAQEIFEEKTSQFSSINREKLEVLLNPLSKDLNVLQNQIQKTHIEDTRERAALKQEIFDLRHLNLKMTEEAANLTRALKGDKKIQGNWGELILERTLESSGLRKGIEYDTQGSYRNAQGELFRPDVIVHLPENKHIVVDSKVSLINWEKSMASESAEDQALYLKRLGHDLRNHIKGLSGKNYTELEGVESLDFVLLFMPIETAFAAVAQNDQDIIHYALQSKIIIATPTTLLATLKTIENIWRVYQQTENSREIAKKAGLMYDKFRLFLEDMEKLGRQLHTCQKSYDTAVNKLCQGRGNLVQQTEHLKDLGVQTKKTLPNAFLGEVEQKGQ